jgi:WD40 repeat protein/tetratricopeptide (TPR) repeat protein
VPKVIDFGLAKAATGMQLTEHTLFTAFGTVAGTPLYMAPEQATFNALDVDSRADIYALGVILYELLAGSTPIQRDTLKTAALDEMLRLVREQEPPPPSSRISTSQAGPSIAANRQAEPAKLGRFVRGELDWIVMKALSKERDRRYESATALAADVERFLSHEPVTAGPPSQAYRLRKFVRRNKGQVAAAALVFCLLVAGVVGTSLGLVAANRAAARAQDEEQAAIAERDEKVKALAAETEARRDETVAKTGLQTALAAERRTAYDMTIPAVEKAFRDNDLNRARALLESCPEDLRGFEWHLLNRELNRGAVTLRPAFTRDGHFRPAQIGVTGDGKTVVAVIDNFSYLEVQTWDAATGAPAGRFEIAYPEPRFPKWQNAISPDFTRVAVWLPSFMLKGRKPLSGEEQLRENGRFTRMLGRPDPPPWSPQRPDTHQPVVLVYDLTTGERLAELTGHTARVSGVAFAPGNERIATGGEDKIVRLWDAAGRPVGTLTGHDSRWAEPLAFTPDGKALVSVGSREDAWHDGDKDRRNVGRRELRVWDVATGAARVSGEVSGVWYPDQKFPVRFTPDGRYAVGLDPLRQVIDLTTGKEAVPVPSGSIALGFTADGQEAVVFTHPGVVSRVRLATGQVAGTYRLPWHEVDGAYSNPTLSRDGSALACFSPNMALCVTDPATGDERRTVPTGVAAFGGERLQFALGPGGTRALILNQYSHELVLQDVTARSPARTLAPLPAGINWALAVSPDGKSATAVSQSGGPAGKDHKQISHVDLVSGRRAERGLSLRFNSVHDLCYSPDGRRVGGLFFANMHSIVNPLDRATEYTPVVLDTVTGAETVGNTYRVTFEATTANRADRQATPRLVCAADGTFLVAHAEMKGRDDAAVQTWRVEEVGTGKVRFTFPATAGQGFAFAPGGQLAALFGRKRGVSAVEVWDIESGAKLPWPGGAAGLSGVESGVFSGDGRRLLTLSESQAGTTERRYSRGPRQPRATVWDVQTGTPVSAFAPPLGATAHWTVFSPDGERVKFYTGLAQNNFASVWNATTGRELLAKLDGGISLYGGAFLPDGRLLGLAHEELGRAFRGSRIQVWDGSPSGPVRRPATADAWLGEAERLMAAGKFAEAVPFAQKVADAHPGSAPAQSALGMALLRAGRAAEAIVALRRAFREHDDEMSVGARIRSVEHFLLALAYQRAGKPDEARQWYDAGEVVLFEYPYYSGRTNTTVETTPAVERARSAPYRVEAASALGITPRPLPPLDAGERMRWAQEVAKKGDHALAAKNADKIALPSKHPGVLYNAACVYALCAAATPDAKLKARYADSAVNTLDKAFAADLKGFFAATGNRNVFDHIAADSDLDSIRDREDFKKLIARVSKPGEVAPSRPGAK